MEREFGEGQTFILKVTNRRNTASVVYLDEEQGGSWTQAGPKLLDPAMLDEIGSLMKKYGYWRP